MVLMAKLLATTGIGSLPHLDIEDAIKYALKFDIPFLPELINIDGTIQNSDKNSCLSLFLEKTQDRVRKIQYPSPEIKSSNLTNYPNTLLFIDAPFIKDSHLLSNIVRGNGLHCCGNIDLQTIISLSPSHYAFDASLVREPRPFIEQLLKNKITPIVGIISTDKKSPCRASNYKSWLKLLNEFSAQCWISPACGLASMSVDQCEEIYQDLLSIRLEILQCH